ncbi:MAG TPA: hypothetical protein VMR73_00440, partial [Candidatus Paceibacterota bacterium]|nr:hypothetical protein [Candidatus Paceibacterota bacterium]
MSGESIKTNVVYVTRDIERALGMEPVGNYFIISNDTPYGQEILKKYPNNVWLVKSDKQLDTFDLLKDEKVKENITRHKIPILVFQNTSRIEAFSKENGWELLNPSAELSKKVEEKMSQYVWLGDLQKYLPKTEIKTVSEIKFTGEPIVVQFNHAHTG